MESHSLKIKSFELNLLVILWNLPGPHAWGGERKGVKGVWYGYPASIYLLKSTLEKPELLKVNSGIFLVSLLDIFLKLFWSFLCWLCTRKWRLGLKGLWETFLLSLQHCKKALKNSPCFACSRYTLWELETNHIYIFHCFVVAIICQQRTKFLVKLRKDQYSECSYMIPDEKIENENKRITFANELYDCKVTE